MAKLEYEFRFRGRTWTLDYHSLDMDEWIAAERATGQHWAHIATGIDQRSAVGLKTFLWLAMRREQASLTFSSLKFKPTELEFEVHADEEEAPPPDPPDSSDSPRDD